MTPRSDEAQEPSAQALSAFRGRCKDLGESPDDAQIDRFRLFLTELFRWNRKINLISSSDPDQVLFRHVLDSLVPLQRLHGVRSVVDVGSGAGFPGVPIQIMRPEWRVVLVEARRKRSSFLHHVVNRLGLEGTEVHWGRVEQPEIQERLGRDPVDALVSRAAVEDRTLLLAARRIVRPAGRVALLKGSVDEDRKKILESVASDTGWRSLEVVPYRLPGADRGMSLVVASLGPMA